MADINMEEGSRYRLTFEGIAFSRTYFIPDGATAGWSVSPQELSAPTFRIEKLEKPLAIGDRVRGKDFNSAGRGEIIGIHDSGLCWVKWEPGVYGGERYDTNFLHDLTRVAP